jgi:hypothetical protein
MTAADCVADAMGKGLREALENLESERRKMRHENCTVMLWVSCGSLGVMGWELYMHMSWYTCLFSGVVAALIGWISCCVRQGKAGIQFKEIAIPELLKHTLPDFRYVGGCCIDIDDFNASGLYIVPDRHTGQDYFDGRVGATALRFSLVHAEERYETIETDTDSNGDTSYRTEEHWRDIFRGLFFVADFNKNFNGYTVVRAGMVGALSGLNRNLVKLEDPRFNKSFTVYSDDQIEARYLLTPKMMERIVGLQNIIGSFEASFSNSSIYIAASGFPYGAFTPDMRLPCADQDQLARILGWIFTVGNIVEELDLNTRIWSKL